jgi:hypothetical protein
VFGCSGGSVGTLVDWYAGRFAHLATPRVKRCADLLMWRCANVLITNYQLPITSSFFLFPFPFFLFPFVKNIVPLQYESHRDMTTIALKKLLISRIAEINDVSFLNAIKTILDSKTQTLSLTSEQRFEITESQKEIESGLFVEQVELDKEFNKVNLYCSMR